MAGLDDRLEFAFDWAIVQVGPCDACEGWDLVVFSRVEAVKADPAFLGFSADSVDVVP